MCCLNRRRSKIGLESWPETYVPSSTAGGWRYPLVDASYPLLYLLILRLKAPFEGSSRRVRLLPLNQPRVVTGTGIFMLNTGNRYW